MKPVKQYAMLVVIAVWRILKLPLFAVKSHFDRTQILSCRMGKTSGKARVFGAELALRIFYLIACARRGNIARVFFRL